MKRKIVIVFGVFCSCLFLGQRTQAQAALLVLLFGDKVASEKFNFSIVTGMNFSNVSNQPDSKMLHNLNFGLGINMKLSDKWYLKPEFRPLSPKGFKSTASLNTGTPEIDAIFNEVKTTRTLKYIDIPVLMAYQASSKIQVALGPQVSFLGKAREMYYGDDDQIYERSIKSQLNTTDFGAAAAITYQLSTKRGGKGMNLQLRYYQGFTNVYKTGGTNTNNVFSFNLEFPFISDDIAKKNLSAQ